MNVEEEPTQMTQFHNPVHHPQLSSQERDKRCGDHQLLLDVDVRETDNEEGRTSPSQGQSSSSSSSSAGVVVAKYDVVTKEAMRAEAEEEEDQPSSLEEDNGRERLRRHRIEEAGRVWVPEIWGQEELLKDWIDCSAFDASLVPSGIMSARAALVQEGRRANSGRFRIENRC